MKNKKSPLTTKTKQKAKRKSRLMPFLSRIMPYILAILFVITLFSLVGWAGGVGTVFSEILSGIFSAFASYFVPVFMLYHSLMWYHDTSRKICARRIFCSFIIIISVSSLQQIIEGSKSDALLTYSISALYENGINGHGGGVIGGLVGTAMLGFGKALSIVIILMILMLMFLQMFNITPVSMIKTLFRKNKSSDKFKSDDQKNKRTSPSAKHRKFDVFDDDETDDIDEDNLSKLEATDTAELKNDSLNVERKSYNSQRRSVIEARPVVSHRQIKPFDESRNYMSAETDSSKYTSSIPETNDLHESSGTLDKSTEFVLSSLSYKGTDTVKGAQTEDYEENDFSDYDGDELETHDFSDYISPEALKKITPSVKEELSVEKKSLFGVLGREKEEKKKFGSAFAHEKEEKSVIKKENFKSNRRYAFPPIEFLKATKNNEDSEAVREELQENARVIVETLNNFNAKTKIVDITRGPTVTRYELLPEAGVRVRSIANLVDDIALNLAAEGIRIECPIPGKSAVGIEVPNRITSLVYLRELLEDNKFKLAKSKLTCALGKSISGENIYIDIERLPHLLIAGATGMGKSVCINSLLVSLLYKATPDDVRLILIDPKRVELSNYNGIPHLLVPVVCEPKKSLGALQWAVSEMERRFEIIEGAGVRNIIEYNERAGDGTNTEKMSRIVIVIDELADLKMAVPEIEDHIMRLTQKARASGIHIIIGTQRPSVDIITGVIKANIPSRIAFRVPSQIDSRTILDEIGAEKLVSRGDMLVKPVGSLKPIRVQGAFITADEIESVIEFLKENASENYDEEVMHQIDSNASKLAKNEKRSDTDGDENTEDDFDPKFFAALELATDMGKISSSFLQRKLGLGFQRAARIIDQMEQAGYIGEANGSKPRDVLITKQDFLELRMRNSDYEE